MPPLGMQDKRGSQQRSNTMVKPWAGDALEPILVRALLAAMCYGGASGKLL